MKRLLFLLITGSLLFTSCKKDKNCSYTDTNAMASSTEINYLQNYLTVNSITASAHSSGIFYHIDNPGTGSTPTVCSNVTIGYAGYILPGMTQFDAQTQANFTLGELIKGWQKGLPLIKSGGSITLYIPPSLAYGSNDLTNNGTVVIPANSYLKFNIQVLDVQ